VLGETPPESYFSTPSNLAFHDLTAGNQVPPATKTILGLSTKFIPTPKYTSSRDIAWSAFERFERDVCLKYHFAGEDNDWVKTKLYVKSTWRPPLPGVDVDSRLAKFEQSLLKLFRRRKGKSNLTPFQEKLLSTLQANDTIVYALSDKGLGPVAIELDRYIKDGLKHLLDANTYTLLSEEQALEEAKQLRTDIYEWTVEFRSVLSDKTVEYLRMKLKETSDDPFGYFYLLYKLHKEPISTRPVCSDCGSLPHALGQFVDEMLQPIVKAQHTYFKNSFELKQELDTITVPPNASVITFDAISMYTKIDTEDCIQRLSDFLFSPECRKEFPHYNPHALVAALEIVMRNNRMRFGDIIAKQLVGIAMGMSPAPTIANLYVAIHEANELLRFLDSFILKLWRFVDDGLAIWLHDEDPETDAQNWAAFKAAVNAGGLGWTFSHRSKKVVFMDLTIEIVDGKFETSLYEKPLALHLYIPPHSSHPPGVTTGLVMGNVLRIYSLCSRRSDIDDELCKFFSHMLDRGYQSDDLIPLFDKAIANATAYLNRSPAQREYLKTRKAEESKHRVFLHLPFHPNDPSSKQLQKVWRETMASPPGQIPLDRIKTRFGDLMPVSRMTVSYRRSLNLGNLLSYRKICSRSGPKVSSFI